MNVIPLSQLRDLEEHGYMGEVISALEQVRQDGALDGLSVWVQRWCRFCPGCIASVRHWKLSWEVLFADACPQCGLWLVDICSRCQSRLHWRRSHLKRCDCGHVLSDEPGRAAPAAVVQLSSALASVAQRKQPAALSVLDGLTLEQSIRLVRLLGAYGTWNGANAPQKIPQLDRLDVSWPISSYAAEVLSTWPQGMGMLLNRLKLMGRGADSGRLGKAFGGIYPALYTAFGSPEFAFLRTAFESYVAEHWTGAIAKRNRRFDASLLDAVAWVPASHACRELQVSRRRLSQLVDEGHLRSGQRQSPTGRTFVVINRADLVKVAPTLEGGVTLTEAAARLGLKRKRLLSMLPTMCPDAKRVGGLGCPWSIPAAWVAGWEDLLSEQRNVDPRDSSHVSMDHLLRYWPWTDEQVGQLLVDVAEGNFKPSGVAPGYWRGVGALMLGITDVRQWFAGRQQSQAGEITLPAAALKMEVKQEVVYALVRSGLLRAVARHSGRRAEWRLSTQAIQQFQERYVFSRDIARILGRSPKAVASSLVEGGLMPVAGPDVNGCRQLVFARAAVDDYLHKIGIAS